MMVVSIRSGTSWWLALVLLLLLTVASHFSTSSTCVVVAFAPTTHQLQLKSPPATKASRTLLYSTRSSSSRSHRFLTRIGLWRRGPRTTTVIGNDDHDNNNNEHHAAVATAPPPPQPAKYRVTTLAELDDYFADTAGRFRDAKSGEINYDALIKALDVQGDTQMIGSPELPMFTHPVAQVLQQRQGQPRPTVDDFDEQGRRKSDGCRVALAIEGGGMRGCISAGMICALGYLNMTAAFDVYYGSSAGSIVGAYAITDQLQWTGPEVYYDSLTTAGRTFIDTRRLLRALGLGLVDPRLFKDVLLRPKNGKPVLNLNYLLKTTMQDNKPLDWKTFVERQKIQPLKVVASGLQSEKPVVMEMAKGHFTTLAEMAECMHASCLLPGIAGPLMNLNTQALGNPRLPKMRLGNNVQMKGYEPLADALVYEPLPYRSALTENCTHAVVIRSRPDGVDVTGKSSFFEKLIFRRFFLRKNSLPHILEYFRKHMHKKLYAQDIIRLNEAAKSTRDPYDLSEPHLLTVAAPPGSAEVTRLEVGREAIFAGFRRGFARCYDCLVTDPAERGRGMQVALEFFPDEILDYDPLEYASSDESAFRIYMREKNVTPRAWKKSKRRDRVTL